MILKKMTVLLCSRCFSDITVDGDTERRLEGVYPDSVGAEVELDAASAFLLVMSDVARPPACLGLTASGAACLFTRSRAASSGGAIILAPQDGHGPSVPAIAWSTTSRTPQAGQPNLKSFLSEEGGVECA
ncbi:hypothetical protein NT6N_09610 [Oceaniferula spumae]|uniref:Uncharacterized protein n=1 Tax=Oceaniferula spumae TaxID=2979115 RepID=A0AAT9FJ05_9BACT